MIGLWIDAQDDEGLSKLVGAKFNTTGALIRDDSACLVGHIRGYDEMGACLYPVPGDLGVGFRFDALCERFGTARIGRLISERARRVLEERKRVRMLHAWRQFRLDVSDYHQRRMHAIGFAPEPTNSEPVEVEA